MLSTHIRLELRWLDMGGIPFPLYLRITANEPALTLIALDLIICNAMLVTL
jgi:hypothetical protein